MTHAPLSSNPARTALKRDVLKRLSVDYDGATTGHLAPLAAFVADASASDRDQTAILREILNEIVDDAVCAHAVIEHHVWVEAEHKKEAERIEAERIARDAEEAERLADERAEAERVRALLARHPASVEEA